MPPCAYSTTNWAQRLEAMSNGVSLTGPWLIRYSPGPSRIESALSRLQWVRLGRVQYLRRMIPEQTAVCNCGMIQIVISSFLPYLESWCASAQLQPLPRFLIPARRTQHCASISLSISHASQQGQLWDYSSSLLLCLPLSHHHLPLWDGTHYCHRWRKRGA